MQNRDFVRWTAATGMLLAALGVMTATRGHSNRREAPASVAGGPMAGVPSAQATMAPPSGDGSGMKTAASGSQRVESPGRVIRH